MKQNLSLLQQNCLRNTAESYEREKILDKSLELYKQWIEIDIDNPYPYFKVRISACLSALSLSSSLSLIGYIYEVMKYHKT